MSDVPYEDATRKLLPWNLSSTASSPFVFASLVINERNPPMSHWAIIDGGSVCHGGGLALSLSSRVVDDGLTAQIRQALDDVR